jgi:hypothetical protein
VIQSILMHVIVVQSMEPKTSTKSMHARTMTGEVSIVAKDLAVTA